MTSQETKLRRFQRIKRRAKTSRKFDRFACLYWRYHFKVHGPHNPAWR